MYTDECVEHETLSSVLGVCNVFILHRFFKAEMKCDTEQMIKSE